MQKIYKMGILENRFAISLMTAATLAMTFSVALVLFGASAYWPFAAASAAAMGAVYGRFSRPYGVATGAGSAIALLSLNAFILVACALLF